MIKRFLLYTIILGTLGICFIFFVDWYVSYSTKEKIYSSTEKIPHNKIGLLLGTSRTTGSGTRLNLYYKYRIEAATQLFKAKKIDYLLISGDNSRSDYDEPTDMKNDLMSNGIPEDRIILDYAGFRTWDSIVRCKKVFGESNITVISQRFHDERAIFIANSQEVKAIGFEAQGVSRAYGRRVILREKISRIAVLIDMLIGRKPKFLGKKIKIG